MTKMAWDKKAADQDKSRLEELNKQNIENTNTAE
jgi:hypothetical protein